MDTLNPSPAMGDNFPPAPTPFVPTDLLESVDAYMQASTLIRSEAFPIRSDENAERLTDHIGGLRGLKTKVDNERKRQKKPHDDAGKAVQEVFTPVLTRLEKALDAMLLGQTEALRWTEENARKAKAKEEAQARAAREEADRLALEAAASGDLDAESRAEEAQAAAAEMQAKADAPVKVSAGSATGSGRTIALVEVKSADIKNLRLLFLHFIDAPEVRDVLQRLANAALRSADWDGVDLPGTETLREKKAR